MTGVCAEGHVHLAQNTSDLGGIAMGTRGEHIEIFILIFLFVEVSVVAVRGRVERVGQLVKEQGCCGGLCF